MRYLRMWWSFFRNALSREMEFRWHFLAMFGMDIVWYSVQYLLFEVLYLYAPNLGGFSRPDILLFLGTLFVIDALNMMLSSANFWGFSDLVRSGELDFYLVKPLSTAFLCMFRYPSVGSMFNLIVAISFLIYALTGIPLAERWLGLVLYPFFVVLGVMTMMAFQFVFMAVNVRVVGSDGLSWILMNLETFGQRPDSIYSGMVRKIMLTAVPMAMLASIPARLLMHQPDYLLIGISGACALLWYIVSLNFFNKALVKYSGASS